MPIKLKALSCKSQRTLALLLHTLASLRQQRPMVLLALLLVVGSTWVFIELADEVQESSTERFDTWAVRMLRQPNNPELPRGPAWLAEVGRDITALGSRAVLLLIVAAVVGYLYLRRAYTPMWLVIFATLSGWGLNRLLKEYFDRARPDIIPVTGTMTPSFPSGHSMSSAIIYLSLGVLLMQLESSRALKTYILMVALILTFLVGISRIYLGVHYPTDVLAGWAVGLAWALGCWLVAQYIQHWQRRRALRREAGRV
jgi:undecaprenyl-diphosphatase